MFPTGVVTRHIKVGPASDLISGALYSIRVMVSPSTSLIWDGTPVVASLKTYRFGPGEEGRIELPVTDQEGYRNKSGQPLELGESGHSHYYKISVYYLLNGSVVSSNLNLRAVIPTGGGDIDVDDLAPVGSVDAALIVSAPTYPDSVPTFVGGTKPTSPETFLWIDTSGDELVIHVEEDS